MDTVNNSKEAVVEEVPLFDKNGNETWRLLKVDGVLFPPPDPGEKPYWENITRLPDFRILKDDILIAAYPRSGTHWVQEVVGMLTKGNTEPLSYEKETTMFEAIDLDLLDQKPSPRILNTHYWPHTIPPKILKGCRIIRIVRNPKDVVVSNYLFVKQFQGSFRGSFSDYLNSSLQGKCMYSSWFDYEREFQEMCQNHHINHHLVYYEDMITEPINTIRGISGFLGLDQDENFFQDIYDACHIDKMRKTAVQRRSEIETQIFGNVVMYRKGKIGDWKNWFTVAENEHFDSICEERLKDSELKFTYG